MKKALLFLIMVVCGALPALAQTDSTNQLKAPDDTDIRTLFKKSDHHIKIGYYIGPEAAYTQFKGRSVFLAGLDMGVIMNHWISVGLAGYGIVNSGNLWYDKIDGINGAYLYGGYAGVKVEFRVMPKSPVHINFPLLIGGGGLVYNTWTYRDNNSSNYYYYDDSVTLDWDSFFVVEPGVRVELNLLKFMRLNAGVSYRYTPDLDLMSTPTDLINNFNANIGLKFGKF
jgi:hypothetical protein